MKHKPWSNDEITLRIRMIQHALLKLSLEPNDNTLVATQLHREVATWEELLQRRQQSPSNSGLKLVQR